MCEMLFRIFKSNCVYDMYVIVFVDFLFVHCSVQLFAILVITVILNKEVSRSKTLSFSTYVKLLLSNLATRSLYVKRNHSGTFMLPQL